jgi:hypothetical protein|tara:strand:- start:132 stop:314 length:183 start_codon:yes stop_codon:yes gene_type:complete
MTDNKKDDGYKGFLDMLAINQLVRILTDFILAIIKLFNPHIKVEEPKKRPLKDLLDRWFK